MSRCRNGFGSRLPVVGRMAGFTVSRCTKINQMGNRAVPKCVSGLRSSFSFKLLEEKQRLIKCFSFLNMANDTNLILLFTFLYIFFSALLIAPPTEFISAGLTVQNIFSNLLGSEDINFVYYHIKRTALTIFVHSLFPLCKSVCILQN